jgi:DNA (cytosine-5)-methyltransferase 1
MYPNTLPKFDLLVSSIPGEAFSNTGNRKGFQDSRGDMFFEVTRILRAKRPAYLLVEFVPAVLSHDGGRTFATMLNELLRLGYSGIEWQILDGADFGTPQARRRLYVVGYADRGCAGAVLPIRSADAKNSIQLMKRSHDERRQHKPLFVKEATKRGYKEAYPGDSVDLSFPGHDTRRGRVGSGVAHTIDTCGKQGVVTSEGRIRRLTPRECFRLQGFSEYQIDSFLKTCTDKHAYRLAGNATAVNVVHALALRLKRTHEAAMVATTVTQMAA